MAETDSENVFKLEEIIFSLLGHQGFIQNERLPDPETGFNTKKGIFQRFMELIAEVADDHITPVFDQILDHCVVPETLREEFLHYAEEASGLPQLFPDSYRRRKVIEYAVILNRNIGTLNNFRFLFAMMGFAQTEITPHYFDEGLGFDDPTYDFDDSIKDFDFTALSHAEYDLHLTSNPPVQITTQVRESIAKIILYNEPIHGRLRSIFHNEANIDVPVFIVDSQGRFIQSSDNKYLTANA